MPRDRTISHLAGLYAGSDDPWSHRTSAYEQAKYAATLAAIGQGPFRDALEIGCGNGTLLAQLAPRCLSLTGLDCIPAAVTLARTAVAAHPHVAVRQACVPDDLPDTSPDLVLLSEVLYFLTRPEIQRLADWLVTRKPRIVCVNWLGDTGESLDGQGAVLLFKRCLGWPARTWLDAGYRIDLFQPPT